MNSKTMMSMHWLAACDSLRQRLHAATYRHKLPSCQHIVIDVKPRAQLAIFCQDLTVYVRFSVIQLVNEPLSTSCFQ